MSFNLKIYEHEIDFFIENVGDDDKRFIANKAASIFQKRLKGHCIDNFRVSEVVNGETSEKYKKSIENGCCGFFDEFFTNPKTLKTFSIGFNYGH